MARGPRSDSFTAPGIRDSPIHYASYAWSPLDHDCKAHLLQAALVGQDPASLAC